MTLKRHLPTTLFLCSLLLLLTQLPGESGAETLTVAQDGSGDFLTIQEAVNAAEDGDQIEVKAGTYNETVVIDSPLTIKGEDKNTTILDGREKGDVLVITANGTKVSGLTIKGSSHWPPYGGSAIKLNASNCVLSDNIFSGNNNAILSKGYVNNSISDNRFMDNDGGIYFTDCFNITIKNNHFTGAQSSSISLTDSVSCTLSGNVIEDGHEDLKIAGQSLEAWNSHHIDETNMVKGNPFRYRANQQGGVIDSGNGPVVLANCNGLLLDGLELSNSYNGIYLVFSDNITVRDCSFMGIQWGIQLFQSHNNTLLNNSHRAGFGGVLLDHSNDNLISKADISAGSWDIWLTKSDRNVVEDSNCWGGSRYGIVILASWYNLVTGNSCSNHETGIRLSRPTGYIGVTVYNRLENNSCFNNSVGIELDLCGSSTLRNNSCHNNSSGIVLGRTSGSLLEDNICRDNRNSGISSRSEDAIFRRNTCQFNSNGISIAGYNLGDTGGGSLEDNICSDNYENGILMTLTRVVSLSNNSCVGNGLNGIYLKGEESKAEEGDWEPESNNNLVENNLCQWNGESGIRLEWTNENLIKANRCLENSQNGILMKYSRDNRLEDNLCQGNNKYGILIRYDSKTQRDGAGNVITGTSYKNNGDNIKTLVDEGPDDLSGLSEGQKMLVVAAMTFVVYALVSNWVRKGSKKRGSPKTHPGPKDPALPVEEPKD